jgi:hypothetical protein
MSTFHCIFCQCALHECMPCVRTWSARLQIDPLIAPSLLSFKQPPPPNSHSLHSSHYSVSRRCSPYAYNVAIQTHVTNQTYCHIPRIHHAYTRLKCTRLNTTKYTPAKEKWMDTRRHRMGRRGHSATPATASQPDTPPAHSNPGHRQSPRASSSKASRSSISSLPICKASMVALDLRMRTARRCVMTQLPPLPPRHIPIPAREMPITMVRGVP